MTKKLAQWARDNGMDPRYARRLYNEGKLPHARQISERIILVDDETTTITPTKTVIYARVSSQDQRASLPAQVGRVTSWATTHGYTVSQVVEEIASGLNDDRRKWNALLQDPTITTILVEHRDRATRFGYTQLQNALAAHQRHLIAIDDAEVEDDLVRDMTEVLTSFCARLYGKRGAKAKALKAARTLQEGGAP